MTQRREPGSVFISVLTESLSRLDRGDRLLLKKLILLSNLLAQHTKDTRYSYACFSTSKDAGYPKRHLDSLLALSGMDCIEIRVETGMGDVMRMEIPGLMDVWFF